MKKIAMPCPSGLISVCDFWTFLNEVTKETTHRAYERIALMRKKEYESPAYRYSQMLPADGIYSTTYHILKMNPASVLVELKKTTTLIERKSKAVDFEELLHELSVKSMMEFGTPSHFFPIGKNRYALVDGKEDVRLYTRDDFSQSLVCVQPKRNFQIYAPYLTIGNL